MLTKPYGNLYRCDYRGITTVAETRVGAMLMMFVVVFYDFKSWVKSWLM